MERKAAVDYINRQTPDAFLERAKRRGFVCPACGNGTGRDGDGIVRNPKTGKYKCFKCGVGGDILDLIGIAFDMENEFNACLKKGAEIYGIEIDRYQADTTISIPKERRKDRIISLSEQIPPPDSDEISRYLDRCHKAVGQTDYYAKRGISLENIQRFRLGYDPAYDEGNVGGHPWHAVIIPTSDNTFEARNMDVTPNSAENGKNKYRKHGGVQIFNLSSLREEKERPIVVCEGIFDALSVIECGGQAVALGSAVNYRYLLEELDRVVPARPLVLLFDNDDTGKINSEKLKNELDKRKIPSLLSPEMLGDFHDANDRLMNDRQGLKDAVTEIQAKAQALSEQTLDAREVYLNMSAGRSLQQFVEAAKCNRNRFRMSTGFPAVDKLLEGGIYTGLYVIGAISSLGKTTLTLQMADGLAAQGRDVLYFSLEQSRYDLMSKSISRETFLYCKRKGLDKGKARTNLSILDGSSMSDPADTEVLMKAFDAYKNYADHLYLFEGIGNISVADIRERVNEHISLTGNTQPVVFVDYLQILKATEDDRHASDKQVVDHNITALKQLSRDFNIPVIAVSSLNRANYGEKVNMAAFKESGAIEYGSDVLIGLQLTGAGTSGFDVDAAKAQNPRKIDLCILKNRNGPLTSVGVRMEFHAAYNCFEESI